MQRWYVASTHPKAESFAACNLKDQGFETYLPIKRDRRIVRRQPVFVDSPLFPSYIFIRFDRDVQRWRSINGTRGIQKLICSGIAERPLPISVGAVEDIQRREQEGEFGPRDEHSSPRIAKGQTVRILSGHFAGFDALCTLSRGERVTVLLSFLGGMTPTELRADQVCAA